MLPIAIHVSCLAMLVAQAGAPAPAGGEDFVAVHVIAPDTESARLDAVVASFAHQGAEFRFDRQVTLDTREILGPREGRAAKVTVWIDVSQEQEVKLFLHAKTSDRFLFRQLALASGLDEVGRETLAQVIESSVSALLEEGRTGLSRAQAIHILSSSAPAQRRWRTDGRLGYGAELFSDRIALVHGPSIGLSLARAWPRWRFGLFARGLSALPARETQTAVGVRLWSAGFVAGAQAARSLSTRLRLGLGLGAGYDWVHVEPEAGSNDAISLAAAQWKVVSVLAAQWSLDFEPARGPAWYLAARLRVDPVARHYDLAGSDGTVSVLSPYRARPGLEIGVRWP